MPKQSDPGLDATIAEIDDMLNGGAPVTEPEPVEEPAQEEEPVVGEAPAEENQEQVVEEEPVVETEPVEAEPEPEPEPKPAPEPAPAAVNDLAAMRKALSEMAARVEESRKEKESKAAPKPNIKQEPVEFVTEEEYEAVFQDRAAFNSVLTKVYQRGAEDALRGMPAAIGSQVTQQVALVTAAKEFFSNNPDLSDYRPYVAHVAARVEAENPELDYASLFRKIEETVRADLSLPKLPKLGPAPVAPKGGDPRPAPVNRTPAQAPGTRGSRNAPRVEALSGQAREIADILDF